MHQIKKYANRKMYDVTTKSYVTLEDIAKLVEEGEEIQIIDNSSGEEITQEIVSQIVGRALDGQARKLPKTVLIQLLRKGSGGLVDFSKKYVSFWQNALSYAEDELYKVDTLIGRETNGDSPDKPKPSQAFWFDQAEFNQLLDDRVDERLSHNTKKQDAIWKEEIAMLKADITKLTARMETFENIFFQLMKIDKEKLPKP